MKKLFLLLTLVSMPVFASGGGAHLDDVDIDMSDTASLQRGAGLFVNYCLSCHSAAFMRYNRMSEDLQIPKEVVEDNMMFTADQYWWSDENSHASGRCESLVWQGSTRFVIDCTFTWSGMDIHLHA